ncbi:MAG: hypothetical protein II916_07200 [Oscillospiraceae bacterium]|nr:hypothetical protein [Oscillospiraceae bacterium]
MKKSTRKWIALLACGILAAAPLTGFAAPEAQTLSIVSAADASDSKLTEYGGWFESAYAVWDANAIGSDVKVSYAPAGSSDFTPVDAELIRGTRVDVPGLKGNTDYILRVGFGRSGGMQRPHHGLRPHRLCTRQLLRHRRLHG